MTKRGYVGDVIGYDPEPESFPDLLDRARYLRWQGIRHGRPKGAFPKVGALLDKREVARANAFARYVARCARSDYPTQNIRETYLPDHLLSEEGADRFLRSVAPRFCDRAFFMANSIPVFEHDSHFIDPNSPETQPIDWTTDMVIRIAWAGGTLDIKHASRIHFDAQRMGVPFAPFGRRPTMVVKSSVFDDFRKASSDLAEGCGWTTHEALRSILTDSIPPTPAIRFRETGLRRGEFAHFPFEFVIEPWVSPETVLKVFRAAQRSLYGRQSQFISEKSCALFDFVMEAFSSGERPTWQQTCDAWNKKYGHKKKWSYDYRNLRKDFMRNRSKIAFPGISMSKRKEGSEGK